MKYIPFYYSKNQVTISVRINKNVDMLSESEKSEV